MQETAARQKSSAVVRETSATPLSSTVGSTVKGSTVGGSVKSSARGATASVGTSVGASVGASVGGSSVRTLDQHRSQSVEKPHQHVEAKADLLFEVDRGNV